MLFKIKPFAAICFVFFLFLQVAVKAQTVNDWENPQLVSKNALPPHAYFIPYPNE